MDQAAYSFSEPTLDTATLSSLTSGDINPFVNMAGLLAIRRLISRGDFGLQHTPAWASATPQLRKAVLLCGSSSNVMKAAEVRAAGMMPLVPDASVLHHHICCACSAHRQR